MEPLTGDGLDDFLEATEQANAIPQPQAWNGIDGLLNGKPFMPEASPAMSPPSRHRAVRMASAGRAPS